MPNQDDNERGLDFSRLLAAFDAVSSRFGREGQVYDRDLMVQMTGLFHRCSDAAGDRGWLGLMRVCEVLGHSVHECADGSGPIDPELSNALRNWSGLLQRYVAHPDDLQACQDVFEFVLLPCWRVPLDSVDAGDLRAALQDVPGAERSDSDMPHSDEPEQNEAELADDIPVLDDVAQDTVDDEPIEYSTDDIAAEFAMPTEEALGQDEASILMFDEEPADNAGDLRAALQDVPDAESDVVNKRHDDRGLLRSLTKSLDSFFSFSNRSDPDMPQSDEPDKNEAELADDIPVLDDVAQDAVDDELIEHSADDIPLEFAMPTEEAFGQDEASILTFDEVPADNADDLRAALQDVPGAESSDPDMPQSNEPEQNEAELADDIPVLNDVAQDAVDDELIEHSADDIPLEFAMPTEEALGHDEASFLMFDEVPADNADDLRAALQDVPGAESSDPDMPQSNEPDQNEAELADDIPVLDDVAQDAVDDELIENSADDIPAEFAMPTEEAFGQDEASFLMFDEVPPDDVRDEADALAQRMLLPADIMQSSADDDEIHVLSGNDDDASSEDEKTAVPDAVRELLDILIEELPQVDVAVSELLGLLTAPGVEREHCDQAAEMAQDMFSRLQSAAETMDLAGLATICKCARTNISALADTRETPSEARISTFRELVPAINTYLKSPMESGSVALLIGVLSDERLPQPMDVVSGQALMSELANIVNIEIVDDTPERAQEASPEDVALEIPEDVSDELLDGLLQELPQYAEELSRAIQNMQSDGSIDDVHTAQRIAHTLKGAGNTVGIRGIATLTHQLEDILIALAKHEVLPTPSLAQTMLVASDCIEAMADFLLGSGPAPDDSLEVLQRVLDWAHRIDEFGPPKDDSEQPVATVSAASAGESETGRAGEEASTPAPVQDSAGEGAILRVQSKLIDELLRIVGESIIVNSQLQERVDRSRERGNAMVEQFELLQKLGYEFEEIIDTKDLSRSASGGDQKEGFDALEMDQYNELHTYSRKMIEAAIDARELEQEMSEDLLQLDDMLVNQARHNRELQESVLETRMVPVRSVFPRLQRSVRQTCRTANKEVELRLGGGDTLIDSDVLREIVDPLMHLLRNAIDHGIEDSESRETAGKNSVGRVDLDFSRDGNNILVKCSDDGRGLDYEAIRRTAEKNELLKSAAEVSEAELRQMILRPNFTTREKVTQTSGRGIGLDAVSDRVSNMGGSLLVSSEDGSGCTFEVRLPVTLLSTHALLVSAQSKSYALASRGIQQIVHIDEGEIKDFGSEVVFQFGERAHRARKFGAVLGLQNTDVDETLQSNAAILIEVDGNVEAVMVDAVLGGRELVVKTLGKYVPKLAGIVGATILGDGKVSPVVDLVDLLKTPVVSGGGRTGVDEHGNSESDGRPVALVVDDSLSARKALAQLLTDSGLEVITARDGMEAIESLEKHSVDIVFADMEMPRMNGIELTAHMRADSKMKLIPVIMVTSRSTAKHREQAEKAGVNAYVTKPFSDDALLDQAQQLMSVA